MKKKVLLGFLFSLIILLSVGCGKEEKDLNGIFGGKGNDVTEKDNDNGSTPSDQVDEISLYSDDTKMVFDFMGVYKLVYYYSGDVITGLEYYFDYGAAATAAYSVATIKSTYQQENIKSVVQKGRYVIVTFNESEYASTTVEEIKSTFSFLAEVQKASEEE